MTTPRPIPISVVVPVKNEAANLAACLARLDRFAEVVVVDSSSVDATPAIAHAHGARLINFEWNGQYPKKRNWVLLNHKLACDWVLFLDADELIDSAFADAAEAAIRSTHHDGFWLRYTNYFLGYPLRHGIAQRKLALFRVGKGLYERIDEDRWSSLDMEVHEHPQIDGRVGDIEVRIDHNDDRGILHFIDRHREYALWESERVRSLRNQGSQALAALTPRQRFKYKHIEKWWYPYFYFGAQYLAKLGILDGYAGLQYAHYKYWYFSTIRLLCAQHATRAGAQSVQAAEAERELHRVSAP